MNQANQFIIIRLGVLIGMLVILTALGLAAVLQGTAPHTTNGLTNPGCSLIWQGWTNGNPTRQIGNYTAYVQLVGCVGPDGHQEFCLVGLTSPGISCWARQ